MSKLLKQKLAAFFITAYRLTGFSVKKNLQPSDISHLKNIAIFSTTALGDFLLNTPAIAAIRKKYPDANITMVVHRRNALLVEGSDMFSDILYWDGKLNGVLKLVKALRPHHLDAVFLLHSRSPYDIVTATLANSEIIIKDVYYNDYLGRETFYLNPFLSVKGNKQTVDVHLIHKKAELLESIGINVPSLEMVIPVEYCPEKRNRRTVGIHLGASSEERCWPIESFAIVARQVLNKFSDIDIELIGGPTEIERNNQLIALLLPFSERVKNSAGKTNLKQLVEKIASFQCLVVGDTGPLHVAIAVKTPTVVMFRGMKHATGTRPLQDLALHKVIIAQEGLGIASIKPDDVLKGVCEILSID
ncbi:glycosyltransferase family 9 protein [Jinshanibacter sp. LJY008]|uniref:Glycosyltransferase family 9 protein n=1 Tax=Limnobaculum eriocheiris TaxID=2897391 RepID=A0A9X1MXG5_9GAMM|nr:glycosyltransferase family 9 protein [Limnobaculum eriocheiris]MCD1126385.1 glycosyltransferase family 9 protein [Limnobaculum eriocheiris]